MYIVPVDRRAKPLKFKRLTQLERNILCNGCGSKGGWFKPPDYCFRASCNHHDFNYWLGGGDTERKWADTSFLRAMLWDSGHKPGGGQRSWLKRYWLKGAAWRYYWAVRAMGGTRGARVRNLNPFKKKKAKPSFNYREGMNSWPELEQMLTAQDFDYEAEFEPDE